MNELLFRPSIPIAALVSGHPRHEAALRILVQSRRDREEAFVGGHGIAETCAVLTGTPFRPRIYPAEARQLIEVERLAQMRVVTLDEQEYREAIFTASATGHTLNFKNFHALAGDNQRKLLRTP